MKFTTPCFVRVKDATAMRKLDMWLDKIGYDWKIDPKSEIKEGRHHVLDEDYVTRSLTVVCRRKTRMWTIHCASKRAIDCGTDVELFKALAAMNDENCCEQWFVNDLGFWQKAANGAIDLIGYTKDHQDVKHFFRKATAEEIIEHFKLKART